MSSLMGGQADGTDDMFAKLESMREVITEVNSQFKDPVSVPIRCWGSADTFYGASKIIHSLGKDHLRVCLHIRVFVSV